MYIQSRYICGTKPQYQNGETAWQCGFHKESPSRRESAKATASLWICNGMAVSSCVPLGAVMRSRNLFPASLGRTATGRRIGVDPLVRNLGKVHLCTGGRRFRLAELR